MTINGNAVKIFFSGKEVHSYYSHTLMNTNFFFLLFHQKQNSKFECNNYSIQILC